VRDKFMPGKPFWNTETADAACGGNPWGGTFLDTFRYLDQLGRLARQEVVVVMHNTLVASDYGLLDENTFEPKPNYWSALLWRKFMGTTVLDAGVKNGAGLHVYAQCLRGTPGGSRCWRSTRTGRRRTRSQFPWRASATPCRRTVWTDSACS
jgi:heparanase